jgi:hypothetical protein
MNGSVIAEMGFDPGVYHTVQFKHTDPVSGVEAETNVSGIGSNSEGNRTFEAFGAEIPSYSEASAEVPSYQHGGSVLNPEHGCELNGGPVGCDRLGIWLRGLGVQVVGGVIIQETTRSKANYLKLNNEDELANIFANRGGIFEKHGNEMWFVMSYSDEANISAIELGSGRARPPSLADDIKKFTYDNYGDFINECVKEVFKNENAKQLGKQDLTNAPDLDLSRTQAELGEALKARGINPGQFVATLSAELGPHGTIYFTKEFAAKTQASGNMIDFAASFVHELGNYLSFKLKKDVNAFGKPGGVKVEIVNGPFYDPDTGAVFESCVGGKVAQQANKKK